MSNDSVNKLKQDFFFFLRIEKYNSLVHSYTKEYKRIVTTCNVHLLQMYGNVLEGTCTQIHCRFLVPIHTVFAEK